MIASFIFELYYLTNYEIQMYCLSGSVQIQGTRRTGSLLTQQKTTLKV